jgi:NADH-quinone oxidoreductase subunit A
VQVADRFENFIRSLAGRGHESVTSVSNFETCDGGATPLIEYLPLLILFALAFVFAAGSFLASGILQPKRPNAAKSAPYECGIVPRNEPSERFPVRFYLVAMIFIIFDIEIIFLYPWAVEYKALGTFGLVEMIVFTVAVFVSLAYLISNGALDWGPSKAQRGVDDDRTLESTIRRVPVTAKREPTNAA